MDLVCSAHLFIKYLTNGTGVKDNLSHQPCFPLKGYTAELQNVMSVLSAAHVNFQGLGILLSLNICCLVLKKIPHTGDKESPNPCG